MSLVKIGKLGSVVDMSEQIVRKLMKEGVLKEGIHFFKNKDLGYTLFDTEAILTWVKGTTPANNVMDDLAKKMIGAK